MKEDGKLLAFCVPACKEGFQTDRRYGLVYPGGPPTADTGLCAYCNLPLMQGLAKKQRLVREAKEAAKFRGHDVRSAQHVSPTTALLTCVVCKREAMVNTKPRPNEIDIGGELVALNCC